MPRDKASSPTSTAPVPEADGPQRLNRLLAAAGLGSRRHCEELILTGRVEVDRQVITELGTKADPDTQEIRVDGVKLPQPKRVHFIVNKPPGVVSTNHDPSGRPRVIDLVPYDGRLFTVGRLDMSSEGLILVTNDGALADRLTHPRYGVEKTYHVEVAGSLDKHELEKLRRGVHLAEGFAKVVGAKVIRHYKQSTMLEIVLTEGRNREIRRILARVGHKVQRLKRVAIGPLRLAELPPGHVRPLDRDELRKLRRAAHGGEQRKSGPKPKPRKAAAKKKPAVAAAAARTVIGGAAPSSKPTKKGGPKPRSAAKPGGLPRGKRPAGPRRPKRSP